MTLNQLYALSDRERFPAYYYDENRPSTVFYADLKVAMAFGIRAVWDTLKRCGDFTKRDPYEVTELYVVLNHLLWEIAAAFGNKPPTQEYKIYKVYTAFEKKYNTISDEIVPTWTDEQREHFYRVID